MVPVPDAAAGGYVIATVTVAFCVGKRKRPEGLGWNAARAAGGADIAANAAVAARSARRVRFESIAPPSISTAAPAACQTRTGCDSVSFRQSEGLARDPGPHAHLAGGADEYLGVGRERAQQVSPRP